MNTKSTKYILQYQEDAGGNWHTRDYSYYRLAMESALEKHVKKTTFHAWRILEETAETSVLKEIIIKDMNKKDILKLIQEQVPCVSTIETRMRDSLDFHDVHITSLVALVEKAFEQGKKYVVNRQCWDIVPKV